MYYGKRHKDAGSKIYPEYAEVPGFGKASTETVLRVSGKATKGSSEARWDVPIYDSIWGKGDFYRLIRKASHEYEILCRPQTFWKTPDTFPHLLFDHSRNNGAAPDASSIHGDIGGDIRYGRTLFEERMSDRLISPVHNIYLGVFWERLQKVFEPPRISDRPCIRKRDKSAPRCLYGSIPACTATCAGSHDETNGVAATNVTLNDCHRAVGRAPISYDDLIRESALTEERIQKGPYG